MHQLDRRARRRPRRLIIELEARAQADQLKQATERAVERDASPSAVADAARHAATAGVPRRAREPARRGAAGALAPAAGPMARWLVNLGGTKHRRRISADRCRAMIARRARARADRLHHRRARVLRPDVSRHARRADPAARKPSWSSTKRCVLANVRPDRCATRGRDGRSTSAPAAAASPITLALERPSAARRRDRHLRGRARRRARTTRSGSASPIASTFRHGAPARRLARARRPDRLEPAVRGRTRSRALCRTTLRDYEPATALFGGTDGLDVIRALIPAAAAALAPGGWLVMEIGIGTGRRRRRG